MDLWKLDGSISNFKGVWCIYFYFISYRNICMQTVKILIIRLALRRLIRKSVRTGSALFAYVHFNRTLCYFFVPPKEALSKDVAKEGNNRSPEYKHLFIFFFFFVSFNTIKCLGWGQKQMIGSGNLKHTHIFFWP